MSEDAANTSFGSDLELAEITGVDGAFVFPERLLQLIWLRGEFARKGLRLRDGRAVRLVRRGRWNRLKGPDFIDAEFRLGTEGQEETIRGDVEVHLRAKDWVYHGHARDPAYDRVVLHVVLFPAEEVATRGGDGYFIPILELLPLLERDLESYAQEAAVERLAGRSFSELRAALAAMSPSGIVEEVSLHSRRRWANKVAIARRHLELFGWEGACHRRALEVFGYRPNREPMLAVAEGWPLSVWRSGELDLEEIWSSQAGSWVHGGVRPANFPRARLEQYARWVAKIPDWPARLLECAEGLMRAGNLGAADSESVVWQRRGRRAHLSHWRKHLSDVVGGGELSGSRFNTMICDAWLPLLAAWRGALDFESGIAACWRDWWPGDLPLELAKLARDSADGADWGQGKLQGFLGWSAAILDRPGRGT